VCWTLFCRSGTWNAIPFEVLPNIYCIPTPYPIRDHPHLGCVRSRVLPVRFHEGVPTCDANTCDNPQMDRPGLLACDHVACKNQLATDAYRIKASHDSHRKYHTIELYILCPIVDYVRGTKQASR